MSERMSPCRHGRAKVWIAGAGSYGTGPPLVLLKSDADGALIEEKLKGFWWCSHCGATLSVPRVGKPDGRWTRPARARRVR